MEYDIYHDESKEDAYWHCFLFIPKENRELILDELKDVRSKIKWNIHFSEMNSKKVWAKIHWCRSLLSILSSSFQQSDKWKMESFFKFNNTLYCPISWRKFSEYWEFKESPKVKIAIFHQKNNHEDMSFWDELSKIETTFRMWLQWAKHFLFNDNNKIIIDGVYIDWFEHYKITAWRDFDIERIKRKLLENSREYVDFKDSFHILDWKTNEDNKLFLDVIDLFLWTFRLNYLIEKWEKNINEDNRYILYSSIKWIIDKLSDWFVRMKNSRFDKCWNFSSWYIEQWSWKFENIIDELSKFKEIKKMEKEEKIMTLF